MKIRIIDFGLPENHRPLRSHANDAGADVYMPFDCTLEPGGIAKIPLGFGLEVPDGYAAYVFPRSSLAAKGVVCELPPVDSGYRGEIHAIVSNVGNEARTLPKDSRIGQLMTMFRLRIRPCSQAQTGNLRLWRMKSSMIFLLPQWQGRKPHL